MHWCRIFCFEVPVDPSLGRLWQNQAVLRKKKEILELISCYARSCLANREVRSGRIAKPGNPQRRPQLRTGCGLIPTNGVRKRPMLLVQGWMGKEFPLRRNARSLAARLRWMGRGWRQSPDQVVRNGQFDHPLGLAGGRRDPANNEHAVTDHGFNGPILY